MGCIVSEFVKIYEGTYTRCTLSAFIAKTNKECAPQHATTFLKIKENAMLVDRIVLLHCGVVN